MATTSQIVAVKSQLVAVLDAGTDATVLYSPPMEPRRTSSIWLGQVRGKHEQAAIKAGRRTREESFTVDLWIETVTGGKTAEPSELAALAVLADVEDVLADDLSIGLSATQPTMRVFPGEYSLDSFVDAAQNGWRSRLGLDLDVAVRLR